MRSSATTCVGSLLLFACATPGPVGRKVPLEPSERLPRTVPTGDALSDSERTVQPGAEADAGHAVPAPDAASMTPPIELGICPIISGVSCSRRQSPLPVFISDKRVDAAERWQDLPRLDRVVCDQQTHDVELIWWGQAQASGAELRGIGVGYRAGNDGSVIVAASWQAVDESGWSLMLCGRVSVKCRRAPSDNWNCESFLPIAKQQSR